MSDIAIGIKNELGRMAAARSLGVSFRYIHSNNIEVNISAKWEPVRCNPSSDWIATIQIIEGGTKARLWSRRTSKQMTLLLGDPEFFDRVFEFVRLRYIEVIQVDASEDRS